MNGGGWFSRRAALAAALLAPGALWTIARPAHALPPVVDAAVEIAAWLAFVAGAALRFWATLYVGGRKAVVLVDTGPYSVCRHPLYLGSLLLAGSAALFLRSPALAASLVAVALAYSGAVVRDEEMALEGRLGDAYARYREQTPALLPDGSRFHSPETIEVHLHGLRLEARRAARWAWIPLLGTLWRALAQGCAQNSV